MEIGNREWKPRVEPPGNRTSRRKSGLPPIGVCFPRKRLLSNISMRHVFVGLPALPFGGKHAATRAASRASRRFSACRFACALRSPFPPPRCFRDCSVPSNSHSNVIGFGAWQRPPRQWGTATMAGGPFPGVAADASCPANAGVRRVAAPTRVFGENNCRPSLEPICFHMVSCVPM